MNRNVRIAPLVLLALLLVAAVASVQLTRPAAAARGGVVANNYVVTLKPGVNARTKAPQKAQEYGLEVRHVYSSVVNGFAGFIPPGQLKKLQNDPDVLSIVEDRTVSVLADTRPTGIRRSQADRNATSQVGTGLNPIGVDVAVIDTGIDPGHPDLNVAGGVSCVPGEPSYADLNGHGTHVAGTIGALDNGIGVVGVAPGVRLWAVRVLNANGEGQFSDVICGIDWVTANAGTIEVANMSLGGEAPVGSCDDGSLHQAVCRSVGAGVTYVVAAGNSAVDASTFVPAAYEEVITVSAIQDFDGAPGGLASNFLFADDALAFFSNYGQPVDIAAPGYNIYSTWPGASYTYSSGTSMASPHVAGGAAIVRFLNPGASPDAVRQSLLSVAWPQGSFDGFTGDRDGFPEPLLNVGAIGADPLPPPPHACNLSVSEGIVGTSVTVACANFGAGESVRIHWDSTSTSYRASFIATDGAGSAKFTVPASAGGVHQVIARGYKTGLEVSLPFTVHASMKLSSTSGKVGSGVSVTLNGFPANTTLAITWDDGTLSIATKTSSTTGAATIFIAIPEGASGPHTIRATTDLPGPDATTVAETYTIVPSHTLSPTVSKVGSTVTIKFRGYAPGESIEAFWYNQPADKVKIDQVTATASALGSADVTFSVPEATKGSHAVEGIGSAGSTSTANLTVATSLVVSASSGIVGSNLTLNITGFGSEEDVTVKWYETTSTSSPVSTMLTTATSALGSATMIFAIPESIGGMHRVEVAGTSSGWAYAYFTVNAAIVLAPASGQVDVVVNAVLTGYGRDETIDLRWYTTSYSYTVIASTLASAVGSASLSFDVPDDATVGDHKVEGFGTASYRRASSTFAVESSGPPPPVDPYCTLDVVSGAVGTRPTISCANFAKSEYVRIYWDTTGGSYKASIWTGSTGGGKVAFTVPDAAAGEHAVIALGATSGYRVEQTFTVVPSMRLSSSSGKVGSFALVYLKGFAAAESVALSWDGGHVLTRVTVSANGSATPSISIPEGVAGVHSLTATGETSGLQESASYTIEASVTVSPTVGYVGASTGVALRGYAAGETVTLRWYGGWAGAEVVDTVTVSSLGSGSSSVTVPPSTKGGHRVEGAGDAGNLASATYTVSPRLQLSTTAGPVGTTFDVALTGFGEEEPITLQWYDTTTSATTLATLTSTVDGSASATFTVPEAAYGSHKVLASGAYSGGSSYVYFSVRGALSLSPVAGPSDTIVTVTVTGYRAGEGVDVYWFATSTSSSKVSSGLTSSLGSATVSFTVPTGATLGDHKVEGRGLSSYLRTSSTFTVQEASSGGSTGIQSVTPAIDVTVVDDFSLAKTGELPPGWTVAPGSSDAIAIKVKGAGGDARLNVAGPTGAGSVWLIRDGAAFTRPDVQVKLHVVRSGSAAGVVVAWNGPHDYVAVVANADADRIEVVEVAGGVVRTRFATPDGSVEIQHGRDYWLRAETGADAGGNAWVSLYWSSDGQTLVPLGSVQGLVNLAGGVGLTAGGPTVPDVDFDDFVARRSQATAPVVIEEPEPAAPEASTSTADDQPVIEPTATPAPAPTEEPTPTPEPAPTEEPTPEPTPTLEPTSTPEPPPTETPTPESSPVDDGDDSEAAA